MWGGGGCNSFLRELREVINLLCVIAFCLGVFLGVLYLII